MGFLGLSWEPLWACWGDLGSSWGKVGWSWGDFWGTSIFDDILGAILGAKRVPKGRHSGGQSGAKIDPKSRCKFKSELITSWSRLGSKLARFPLRLGVKNVDVSIVFKAFRENHHF